MKKTALRILLAVLWRRLGSLCGGLRRGGRSFSMGIRGSSNYSWGWGLKMAHLFEIACLFLASHWLSNFLALLLALPHDLFFSFFLSNSSSSSLRCTILISRKEPSEKKSMHIQKIRQQPHRHSIRNKPRLWVRSHQARPLREWRRLSEWFSQPRSALFQKGEGNARQ